MQLVQRLEGIKPVVYSVEEMYDDFQRNQKHLINCSHSARLNNLYVRSNRKRTHINHFEHDGDVRYSDEIEVDVEAV